MNRRSLITAALGSVAVLALPTATLAKDKNGAVANAHNAWFRPDWQGLSWFNTGIVSFDTPLEAETYFYKYAAKPIEWTTSDTFEVERILMANEVPSFGDKSFGVKAASGQTFVIHVGSFVYVITIEGIMPSDLEKGHELIQTILDRASDEHGIVGEELVALLPTEEEATTFGLTELAREGHELR